VRAALFGLQKIYRPGYSYKKTGVMLIGIGPAAVQQLSLLAQHGDRVPSARLRSVCGVSKPPLIFRHLSSYP
jgi:hypothetical protein